MKKLSIGIILAMACVLPLSGAAHALSISNGSFETGDHSGWVINSDGPSKVATSDSGYTATDGIYFFNQFANSTLSLTNRHWHAGQVLRFDWNFIANDYMPFNDYATFRIVHDMAQPDELVYLADVADVWGGDYISGWQTYEYKFMSEGSGTLEFGVYNDDDDYNSSQLYIDNVRAKCPCPEPATVALLGIGLVGLAGAEVRRRRKKKAADNS